LIIGAPLRLNSPASAGFFLARHMIATLCQYARHMGMSPGGTEMIDEALRRVLETALVRHDRMEYEKAQKRGTYYNNHALALMLSRVDDVVEDVQHGALPRDAIMAGFTGKLRTVCLKAIGARADHTEIGGWAYRPVSASLNAKED
jgi:hypothetical protein